MPVDTRKSSNAFSKHDDNGAPSIAMMITVSFRIAALSLIYVSVSDATKPYSKELHNELTIPEDPFQVVRPSPNRQQGEKRRRRVFPRRESRDDNKNLEGIEEKKESEAQLNEQKDEKPPPPPPQPPPSSAQQPPAPLQSAPPQRQVRPPPPRQTAPPQQVRPPAPRQTVPAQQVRPKPPPPPKPAEAESDEDESIITDYVTVPSRPPTPKVQGGGAAAATRQRRREQRRDPFWKFERHDGRLEFETFLNGQNHVESNSISVSLDPVSGVRLAQAGIQGSAVFGTALIGTLRLLAPLIVARRGLASMIDMMSDWYTGRYLRKTVKHMEHQYWRYYQVPAALRSFGRLGVQTILFFMLGRIMEWMIGLESSPCHLSGFGGCHWYCGLLWIISVVAAGHAFAAAIAVWGGPLRIQVASMQVERPSARRVFTRPWHLMQFMRDPDKWLREIAMQRKDAEATLKPFHPDPLLFPTTWEPLRVLQMIAIAKEMAGSDRIMYLLMRQVLAQQAIGDEWYRAFMCEKRVALGIALMSCYFIATLRLFWTAATSSSLSALLVLPSLLAVMISAWMNIFIYFERREAKRQQQAVAESRGRIGNQRPKLLLWNFAAPKNYSQYGWHQEGQH